MPVEEPIDATLKLRDAVKKLACHEPFTSWLAPIFEGKNMIDLSDAKHYLGVDLVDDDALITSLIAAATAASADYLGLPLDQMTTTVPSPIKAATLLLVNDLYENRTSQGDRQLYQNSTYERLLNPYRVITA